MGHREGSNMVDTHYADPFDRFNLVGLRNASDSLIKTAAFDPDVVKVSRMVADVGHLMVNIMLMKGRNGATEGKTICSDCSAL